MDTRPRLKPWRDTDPELVGQRFAVTAHGSVLIGKWVKCGWTQIDEITPNEARALAQELLQAADEAG